VTGLMARTLLGLWLSVFLSSAQACTAEDVISLLAQRLALMPAVARYKWENALPIENAERESRVLASAAVAATEKGLEPLSVQRLLQVQIVIAKQLQEREFSRLGAGAKVEQLTDLDTLIRPRLLQLGASQLSALSCLLRSAGAITETDASGLAAATADLDLDQTQLSELLAAAMQVRLAGAARPAS
jgi:chorismate mutase